jgi:hypothetical protein
VTWFRRHRDVTDHIREAQNRLGLEAAKRRHPSSGVPSWVPWTSAERAVRYQLLLDAGVPAPVAFQFADYAAPIAELLPFEHLLDDPSAPYPSEPPT